MAFSKQQCGIILFHVLLILTMLTLLSLALFGTSRSEIMMAQYFYQRHQLFYFAEATLRTIEKNIINLPSSCILPQPLNKLAEGNVSSCQFSHPSLPAMRYSVEIMQEATCLKLNGIFPRRGIFYRVTVWTVTNKEEQPIVLQSTVLIETSKTTDSCKPSEMYEVKAGRQSWQQLN